MDTIEGEICHREAVVAVAVAALAIPILVALCSPAEVVILTGAITTEVECPTEATITR